MNDRAHGVNNADLIRTRTRFEAVAVGLRLARSVARRFGLSENATPDASITQDKEQASLSAALEFTRQHARLFGIEWANSSQWQADILELRRENNGHALSRLAKLSQDPALNQLLADLVLLAALPEIHEGYCTLFRQLHPQAQPYPSVALALHWQEEEQTGADPAPSIYALRDQVEELLLHSPLAALGLLQLLGDGPWHGRSLRLGPGVWAALNAREPEPAVGERVYGFRAVPGLASWLQQPEAQLALNTLRSGTPCLITLLGGSDTMRATRMRALLGAAGASAIRCRLDANSAWDARIDSAISCYGAAYMHRAYPWLELCIDEGDPLTPPWTPGIRRIQWAMPILLSCAAERLLPDFGLPILTLRADPLPAVARRQMWGSVLPQLAPHAGMLAARYPVDPDEALGIASDLALRQQLENRALDFDDIGSSLRARTAWRTRPGVRRIIPQASWPDLLLPERSSTQLQQAVQRTHQQLTVLDDWGFEQGRHDRRGLRLLFYGPPGTGKTLAAEAMAKALGIDLLAVDISSLVSKWIGETEKNLAAVFDVAESSRALLLFDEADALFGRRTDANDAHDRYANLETAFLLQRLERYEGVAVLATNLRSNLDTAFTRRFEYIVEFPEPDAATRLRLWTLHVPAAAPLAKDIDFQQLADWYAISGAQIRNAALGAAFLAAAEGDQLRQRHFLLAIAREYEKAGKAHPGQPPHKPGSASA